MSFYISWFFLLLIFADDQSGLVIICYKVKFIKTDRYQIQTVNIDPGSFFRYPTITWIIADVGIPNRHLTKEKPHLSL
jgi:hypothetical protein